MDLKKIDKKKFVLIVIILSFFLTKFGEGFQVIVPTNIELGSGEITNIVYPLRIIIPPIMPTYNMTPPNVTKRTI